MKRRKGVCSKTIYLIASHLPKDWDAIRPTKDCLHCKGTGRAPSADGRTACGFCK